jgi:hypothetical protein
LSAGSLGETDAEHTEEVSISGLGLHEGLDGGVPLLDNGALLIAGNVHTVEVGVAIEALNFLDLDLHLSPGLFVAVSVQISQRYLKHTALEGVGSNLLTSSPVARSESWGTDVEDGRYMNIVPFLLGEGVSAKHKGYHLSYGSSTSSDQTIFFHQSLGSTETFVVKKNRVRRCQT